MVKNSTEYQREYMKKYNEAKRNAEKIECECGSMISQVNKHIHRKSLKHKYYILLKEKNEN